MKLIPAKKAPRARWAPSPAGQQQEPHELPARQVSWGAKPSAVGESLIWWRLSLLCLLMHFYLRMRGWPAAPPKARATLSPGIAFDNVLPGQVEFRPSARSNKGKLSVCVWLRLRKLKFIATRWGSIETKFSERRQRGASQELRGRPNRSNKPPLSAQTG